VASEAAIDRLEGAVLATGAIVKGAAAADLAAPSPCAGWDARAVINHTIGAMTMFRDVVEKGEADVALLSSDLVGADAATSFERAGREVVEQFRRRGDLEGTLRLPFGEFPAAFGIALLTNDVVVHGWDVARATGQPAAFDDDLVAACGAFARATFENPEVRGNDFGPEAAAPEGASAMDALAAYLGRSV
jgi:uncharacterized protein (TIGR03086 family)